MDAIKAFVQFITDLFAALAEFLGDISIFGTIINGIGDLEDAVEGETEEQNLPL